MRVLTPRLPLPRDEAADYRISVFLCDDRATVKVRKHGETAYFDTSRDAVLGFLGDLVQEL